MFRLQIRRGLAVGVGLALLTASLAIVPVAAASEATIRGVMTPDTATACTGDPLSISTYVVSGSLQGCWYIETSVPVTSSQNGGVWSGQELFVGCLGSACGSFRTTYTFWAKYAADGSEIHGHCHHDLVSGTGAFSGATGFLQMHDLPDGTASPAATYAGHISG